jgi:polyisoprenoid-binding protein YceI
MSLRLLALPLALALTTGAASAEPWTVDPSHASITFTVNHFGFSDVVGQFRSFAAEVDFNPEDIAATKATFTIDAASFDSNFGPRDEHVKSPDFLNVAAHPSITFVTTAVAPTGETTADVTGDLTLLGVTQPVTFKAVLNQRGPSPLNPEVEVAGLTITGEVDRTAFGMETYAPAIAAVIPVTINLEMSPTSQVSN